jgi:peptidylprolyl isomerase
MIRRTRFMIIAGIATLLCACQGTADAPTKKENNDTTKKEAPEMNQVADNANDSKPAHDSDKGSTDQQIDMVKLSEAFGNFIGKNLQMPGVEFNLEGLIQGIRSGAEGKPSPLSDKEYEAMMGAVQEKAFKELAAKNMKEANEFLSKNSKAANVVELIPEKVQYEMVVEGKGPAVAEHASPMINYTGKYLDGTTFGSSEETGGAIAVPLDQTIPGFSKGVVGMKEGEKRKIFVHPDLGYGATGQLPPNKLLIFEVEVVKANGSAEPTADAADVTRVAKKDDANKDKEAKDSDDEDNGDDDEDEDDEDADKEAKAKADKNAHAKVDKDHKPEMKK